jgi:hypothetical protein
MLTFEKKSINDEIDSLESNKTWLLVDLSHGCKQSVVFGFWKRKLKPDGSVAKYKVHLVEKGFRQKEKI